MINNPEEWKNAKTELEVGTSVDCEVVQHAPFGVFVTVGTNRISGIIERVRMNQDGFQTPEDFPPIGSVVKATVLGFRDWNNQVELALAKRESTDGQDSAPDQCIEVGLRFGKDGKLLFFGLEQINEMIADGRKVKRIEEGGAIMVKSGESSETVTMRFEGFSVLVVIQSDSGTRDST